MFPGSNSEVDKVTLQLDHVINFFFNGAFVNKPVHLNIHFLANAKSPVGCLCLYGRVPPQIVMDNMIGGSEVQAGASSLERKDEYLVVSVLKLINHFVTLLS